jgi:hypothetical protein
MPREASQPTCEHCGDNIATCRGRYETMEEDAFACDDCCGHACEDGRCDPLPMASATITAMPPRGGSRPGAGRKSITGEAMPPATFVRLPADMKAAAQAAAESDGDDLSTWIRGAVRERLARLDRAAKRRG